MFIELELLDTRENIILGLDAITEIRRHYEDEEEDGTLIYSEERSIEYVVRENYDFIKSLLERHKKLISQD